MINIILIFLLLLVILKVFIIINAIFWLGKNGKAYNESLKKIDQEKEQEYYKLFELHNGGFFPFGFKDYKLRNKILQLKNRKSFWDKTSHFILRNFQRFFFRYERLTLISVITLFILSYLPCLTKLNEIIMIILAISLLLGSFLLSIEAIWSHAILGSYAKSFHMQSIKNSNIFGGSQFLIELKVVFSKIFISIISGSIAFYLSDIFYCGMKLSEDISNNLDRIFHFIYFSLTTLLTVGYGDIYPISDLGIFLVMLFQIQSFTIIVLIIGFLMGERE